MANVSPIIPASSALIQDEVLGEVVLVLQGTNAAGPSFLNCLGSIIEACVLHERVFVQPLRKFEVESRLAGARGLEDLIDESELVKSLLREGVFSPFPPPKELDGFLAAAGADYSSIDLLEDLRWTLTPMLAGDPVGELALWSFENLILENASELFEDELCTDQANGVDIPVTPAAKSLVSRGLPVKHLVTLDGWNRGVRGLQKMARPTGLNLYVVPAATLHQLGSLSASNLKARAAYHRIQSEISKVADDRVGYAEFSSYPIPPLTSIAITRCKGDPSALCETLLQIRDEHKGLRQYLTAFENDWVSAPNRRARVKLQSTFEAAMSKLIERETRPHDRLFYKIWDIVKAGPRVLEALGDKLVAVGREEATIGQVRGLRAYWKAALDAPLRSQVDLCLSLASSVAPESVWDEYARVARGTQDSLKNKVWQGS